MLRLFFTIPFFIVSWVILNSVNTPCIDTLALASNIFITTVGSNNNSAFIHAIYTFHNVSDRNAIRLVTKGVPGIYCWINNINGKCYVGKANNLYLRLSNYYQTSHIFKNIYTSLICKAIRKYTLANFSLVILEVNPKDLAVAEQYWITLLKPEYNTHLNVLIPIKHSGVLKPDRFGSNNSFFGRKHTPEAIAIIRAAALARTKPNKEGFTFTITDILTNTTTVYPSIRKGVEAMAWDQGYIMNRLKNGITKPYRGRYMMVVQKRPTN